MTRHSAVARIDRRSVSQEDRNPASLERADALLDSGLITEAGDMYAAILESTGELGAHLGLARCAYVQRELHTAVGHLQFVLAADPHFPGAVNDLGVVYFAMGLYDQAHEQLRLAADAAGADPLPWRNLIDVAMRLDASERCREYCIRLLDIDPNDQRVRALLLTLDRDQPARSSETMI